MYLRWPVEFLMGGGGDLRDQLGARVSAKLRRQELRVLARKDRKPVNIKDVKSVKLVKELKT